METGHSFYIKTFGCKVNQYESQVIRENFLRIGYREAKDLDDARVCIVNTCTVTSKSDREALRLVQNLVKKKKVIITGCLVEGKDLGISNLRGVDFIVRNKDKYRIPYLVSKDKRQATRDKGEDNNGITNFKGHTRAFVKVQDGCNNLCSYCKVRVVRGKLRSKPFKDVIKECKVLLERGYKEIVLAGICLGSYGRDLKKNIDLSGLIKRLCGIDGDWRLRLSSIEPKDVNEDLIKELVLQKRLCKHLHIPFQSGDSSILKKMNRPYKREDYLKIVHRLRREIKDIAISTDIMVGFPGESERSFQNTVDFIKEARPMRMHVFGYSKREGTKAYFYKDEIEDLVKKERGHILSGFARELSCEFAKKSVGKSVKVLIEEDRSKDGYLKGYTDRYIKVFIDGPDTLKGKFLQCQLILTNGKSYGILPLNSV